MAGLGSAAKLFNFETLRGADALCADESVTDEAKGWDMVGLNAFSTTS